MLETNDIILHHWYRCLYKGCEELCCIRIENKDEKNHILYADIDKSSLITHRQKGLLDENQD